MVGDCQTVSSDVCNFDGDRSRPAALTSALTSPTQDAWSGGWHPFRNLEHSTCVTLLGNRVIGTSLSRTTISSL